MSGCAICVNDLYADSLTAYKDALADLRKSLTAAKVPQDEWPARVRPEDPRTGAKPPTANVSLSAFEAMEQALTAKRTKPNVTS